MKLSWFGRLALALFASLALGLGMTACGGGTIAYVWVVGQQYNQIAGFKVDDYTGNLTQIPHEPFASQGGNPVMLLVKPGGRYVYVLNQGTGDTPTSNSKDANIAVFSVGGDGNLAFEESYNSQGFMPVWMQMSGDGSYLYVLDKYSQSGDGNGSITVFSIDATTGRLTLVLNTQSIPPGGAAPTYFEVGASPIMMKSTGACLYTVNSADQSITPFSEGAGGQLVTTTTGKILTTASNISSINGNAAYIMLTDAGSNAVIPYNVGSSCGLNILNGGIKTQSAAVSHPTNTLISNNNRYLYVLNQSTTSTQVTTPFSSISAYLIDPQNGLTELTGSPFSVDSGPVCAVEDPTNKYIYISAHNAGVITGKIFDPNTGQLSQLTRGSTFSATGLTGCLAMSPNV